MFWVAPATGLIARGRIGEFVPAGAPLFQGEHRAKLAIELEYKQPHGEYVKMKLSEEYYDFGVEANIEAPPAKSVIDVTPRLKDRGQAPRRRLS